MTTTSAPPAQTALMPLDPAVSPQQALRVLPIRANLLPGEITEGRNARRTRNVLIFAIVLTLALLGGWYAYARKQRDLVDQDLASVTQQVDSTRAQTRNSTYRKVTATIEESENISTQLKIAMASDLPWNTLLNSLRNTGVKKINITTITGSLDQQKTAQTSGTAAPAGSVGTLTLSGNGPDKRTIAQYVDAAARVPGVTKVYLTMAGEQKKGSWTFSVTAEISSTRLCGRFTTACKDGGK